MGGVASSSKNNDDLIDNLLEADYIKTSMIERVFRAVDRAEYFLLDARSNAYKDIAWKSGNLHLSAPCIYSEVMEALCLEPGLSFLNLGSGTGYLSTMVGLVLGCYGINHGIEYHADVVQYANKKLDDFRKFSGAIDEFDYCEPKFVQGNALCLTSESYARYDRVYCSAACPELYEAYMKNLIKVGGILVMPYNDQLLQVRRKSESNWVVKSLLPVSFASIIQPAEGCTDCIQLIEVEPMPLQALCRAVVRNMLRKNIELEHPLVKRAPKAKRRALRRLVVPLVESEDSSDEERSLKIGGLESSAAPQSHHDMTLEQKEDDEKDEDTSLDSINAIVDALDVLRREEIEEIVDSDENWVAEGDQSKRAADSQDNKKKKRVKIYGGSLFEIERRRKSATVSSSDEDSDHQEKRKRRTILHNRVVTQLVGYSSSDVENEEEAKVDDEMRMFESSYTEHMKSKIQGLPLPPILKRYLNFYRKF